MSAAPPAPSLVEDAAVQLERTGPTEHVFTARISPDWWIVDGPNGGYVAAIAVNALAAAEPSPSRRLRSVTLHYLRPPRAGECRVLVRRERAGRSVSTSSFAIVQDDTPQVLGMATAAVDRDGPEFAESAPPAAPPPEDAATTEPNDRVPIGRCFELRPTETAASQGRAESGGWLRLRRRVPTGDAVLAAMCDAWWPPVFEKLGATVAVPTVDLTVHFHHRPDPDDPWVHGAYRSPEASGGFLVEDCQLWDRRGRLLAESRQLALVRELTPGQHLS